MKITKSQFPKAVELMKKAFPDYTGRKFKIEAADRPINTMSFWDGGSCDKFVFVRADGAMMDLPNEAPWKQDIDKRNVTLVPGLACVERSWFCGRDMGCTLHLNPADMPKMLENKGAL